MVHLFSLLSLIDFARLDVTLLSFGSPRMLDRLAGRLAEVINFLDARYGAVGPGNPARLRALQRIQDFLIPANYGRPMKDVFLRVIIPRAYVCAGQSYAQTRCIRQQPDLCNTVRALPSTQIPAS